MKWERMIRRAGAALAAAFAGECIAQKTTEESSSRVGKPATEAAAGVGETVKLEPVEVRAADDAGYDRTGFGYYEQQLRESPFSNDLISSELVTDHPLTIEIRNELRQIAAPAEVDLATGDARLALRGFPAPLLRNGFVTMGASDMLNTSRTITIQGALVPVLGRAAPGGIQDFITWRPRTSPAKRVDYTVSTNDWQNATTEITGPTVPKRAWHRVAADWTRRVGPEEYAVTETRTANAAVTWKHTATASTLYAVDFQQVHATSGGGIPEYRPANGQKIVGPYRELAGFNTMGPQAGLRRRTLAATVLFDGQPRKNVALRAGLEAWWRSIEQDRFTTSLYNVALGRFEGTREPRHIEQPHAVQLAHVEATVRFSRWGAEHKVLAAANHTWGRYGREELALSVAARNALPESVRLFDPDTPDYWRPAFDRAHYSRVLADREENAGYTALELSHRVALRQGRVVFTSGLRQDYVAMEIAERTPGAKLPWVTDRVQQMTYHTGLNYQVVPSRLLLFSTASTAFEPSSRVDARTGRLQPNQMTRGYELGLKGRLPQPLIEVSLAGFAHFNEHISRRNPLYDDPIFDANHTQPQLVASGEETFRGGKFEGRWKPSAPWTVYLRAAYARAVTTSSPDLPQEVGRALTRYPAVTAAGSVSRAFPAGKLKGLSLSGSWTYVSKFVGTYGDAQRERQDYPSYSTVTLGANYPFRRGKRTHSLGLSVRNLFDYDFVAHQARLGSERELVLSYRLTQ